MNMRNRIMKHPVQAKYLLILFLAMIAPTLLMGFCLYSVIFHLLAEQIAFPEAVIANLVPVINRVNGILLILLPILAAIILWIGLIISHRFGGPIERLELDLDKILNGDYLHRIRLRQHDDLRKVSQKINAILDDLNKR